ncbi:LPS translocon maturation chaperone LptM [Rhodothalassium salexigens]|uniref:LPS translocon maturation chaperone LptM n=1 Tax=Rhodothalassium salexigens TaxID=1086 RepID=UPI001911C67E|nr:lipoprotein [Rhodothalassium salexigens]
MTRTLSTLMALALVAALLAGCGRRAPLDPPTEAPAPAELDEIPGDDKKPGRP